MKIAEISRPLKRSKSIQQSQRRKYKRSTATQLTEYSSAKHIESIYFQVLRLSHKFIIHIHDETHALAIIPRFNHSTINLL